MASRQIIFDAITASKTIELHTLDSMVHLVDAGSLLFEVVGSLASEWVLNIQGKVHEDGSYKNIDWVETFIGGGRSLDNSSIEVRGVIRRFYLVPHPPQLVRLVATAKSGSLSVYGSVGSIIADALGLEGELIALNEIAANQGTIIKLLGQNVTQQKDIIKWVKRMALN